MKCHLIAIFSMTFLLCLLLRILLQCCTFCSIFVFKCVKEVVFYKIGKNLDKWSPPAIKG